MSDDEDYDMPQGGGGLQAHQKDAWSTMNMDPKTKLNTALQKKTGHAVKKADVLYITEKGPEGGYISTLTVRRLNLVVKSPVAAINKRDAEKFAAAQALIHMATNGDWVGDVPLTGIVGKLQPVKTENGMAPGLKGEIKRGRENEDEWWGDSQWQAPANMPRKDPVLKRSIPTDTAPVLAFKYTAFTGPFGMLKQLIQEALGRPFNNSDMIVTLEHTGKGFCAHISLPSLKIKLKGATSAKREDAERSASAVACRRVQEVALKHTTVLRYPLGGEAPNVALAPAKPGEKPKEGQPMIMPEQEDTSWDRSVAAGYKENADDAAVGEMLEEMEEWKEMRLEKIADGEDMPGVTDFGYWYGQICLICMQTVTLSNWDVHCKGSKHTGRYQTMGLRKRPEAPRPMVKPSERLLGTEYFMRVAGWHAPSTMLPSMCTPILTIGEMDFSFSLAVARLRPRGAYMIASSHLKDHDPKEPEIHPQDDDERRRYRRMTLPAMGGALFKNMEEFKDRGGHIRCSVDAMDLDGTLRNKRVDGQFGHIIFPFPRASMQRTADPRNSRLLRNFFLSCRQHGFLAHKGMVQLILVGGQYEDWDVNCMAADAGMYLSARAEMPVDFYQAREVSGKPFVPVAAELLCFRVKGE